MSQITKKIKKVNTSILTATLLGLVIIGLVSVFFIEGFASSETTETEDIYVVSISEPKIANRETFEIVGAAAYAADAAFEIEAGEPVEIFEECEAEVVEESVTIDLDIPEWTEDERAWIIHCKKGDRVDSKTIERADVRVIEPKYNEDGKLVVKSAAEAMCLDIRTKSNWTADDFYGMLNEEMYNLVPLAIQMEKELGVNALYTIAVGANETGWGRHMAGKNNYFNWTNDGVYHFNYDNVDEFNEYSIERYKKYYTDEAFFSKKLGFTPEFITPEVVNVKYALHSGGGTNWNWSNTVTQIMCDLSYKMA